MTRITESLIRKRAEHNACVISTLEEISLHQQDIERLEYIDKWCKDLKILYLQSNLIPKIENVGRLKKLDYLNLALNNIEVIENLEGCESLRKLDLTVNFVGELTSIERLKGNYSLRELFLTGNPCTEYEGYRDYVIASLPHLQFLDGLEIEKSERIKAVQVLHVVRDGILEQQARYLKKREKEKNEAAAEESKNNTEKKSGVDGCTDSRKSQDGDCVEEENLDKDTEEEKERKFWQEKTTYTPESRLAIHKHQEEKKNKEQKVYPSPDPPPRQRRLETDDGRLLNVNEAKIDFELQDDIENGKLLLRVSLYRHLDTSLCDVDVQPTCVRVTVKGKMLQIVLPEEVLPDSSVAQRSQTTGHLLIAMPKMTAVPVVLSKKNPVTKLCTTTTREHKAEEHRPSRGQEELEVAPRPTDRVDYRNIVTGNDSVGAVPLGGNLARQKVKEQPNSDDFIDDPSVPPLL